MYKLFEIKTKLGGDFIVLATSITNAADALNNAVEKSNKYNNINYSNNFTIKNIELISEEIEFDNNNDGHINLNDTYKKLIVSTQVRQKIELPETKYFDIAKAKELVSKGFKVSNLNFSSSEYIQNIDGNLCDEDGEYVIDGAHINDAVYFWENSPHYEWYIYHDDCDWYDNTNNHNVQPHTFDKRTAMKLMIDGKKVTHKSFDDDEYVTCDKDMSIVNDGGWTIKDFWLDRNQSKFQNGWMLFKE